jgi:hypothetical protein
MSNFQTEKKGPKFYDFLNMVTPSKQKMFFDTIS